MWSGGGYIANCYTQCKVIFQSSKRIPRGHTVERECLADDAWGSGTRACSACSGDYENPDLTAPNQGEGDVENFREDDIGNQVSQSS